MALPDDVSAFTLTFGQYRNVVGQFAMGGRRAKITPVDDAGNPVRIMHIPSGSIILPEPVVFKIGQTGVTNVGPLPHTDNENLTPKHFQFKIEWLPLPYITEQSEYFENKRFAAPTVIGQTLDYDRLTATPPDGTEPSVPLDLYEPKVSRVGADPGQILILGENGRLEFTSLDLGNIDLSQLDLDQYALKTDPRFTDPRTPTTHTHPAPDLTGYVQTNDPRLTNSRTPSAHQHPASDITGLVYYTDERAQDAAASLLTEGSHTGITYTYNDETGKVDSIVTAGGGAPAEHTHNAYLTQAEVAPVAISGDYSDLDGRPNLGTGGIALDTDNRPYYDPTATVIAASGGGGSSETLPTVYVRTSAEEVFPPNYVGTVNIWVMDANSYLEYSGPRTLSFKVAGLWMIFARMTTHPTEGGVPGNIFGSLFSSSGGRFSEFGTYSNGDEMRWNGTDTRRFNVGDTLELHAYCKNSKFSVGGNHIKDTGLTLVRLGD